MSDKAISTDSLSHESRTFPPSPAVVQRAHLNAAQFNAMYQRSIREPEAFWLEQAQTLDWVKPPTMARKFNWIPRRAQWSIPGSRTASSM